MKLYKEYVECELEETDRKRDRWEEIRNKAIDREDKEDVSVADEVIKGLAIQISVFKKWIKKYNNTQKQKRR